MRKYLNVLSIILICIQGLSFAYSAPHLQKETFIRDAEIEQGLQDFLTPLFQAAGLDAGQLKIMLFNSPEVNASAGLNHTIIVYTGLLNKTESLGELLGVLAHETGHIAGRHNERLTSTYGKMQLPAMATMVLAGAAAIATGAPEALMAGMAGMDMMESTLLSYHRGHESSADQAACKYLDKLGWSPEGFYSFLKVLHKQEMLSAQHHYAYKRTHPFTIDRLRLAERHVMQSKYRQANFPDGFDEKFKRMRVKVQAYTDYPERIFNKFPARDNSLVARYARAIAYHRKNQMRPALQELDALLQEQPDDPYFLELKGQILFESGKVAESYIWYKKAVGLLPQNTLLKVQLAHIILEQGNKQLDQEALDILRKVEKHESESPFYWRLRATAYGRLGNEPMAALMLAEEALCYGKITQARTLATRAIKGLKADDKTARQRAKDIQEIEMPEEE